MGVRSVLFTTVLVMAGLTAYVGEARSLHSKINLRDAGNQQIIVKRSLLDELIEKIEKVGPEKDANSTASTVKPEHSNPLGKPEEKGVKTDDASETNAASDDKAKDKKNKKKKRKHKRKKAKKENAKNSETKSHKKKSLGVVDGVYLDELVAQLVPNPQE